MVGIEVEFTDEGEDDLNTLDKPIRKRVIEKIRWLAKNLSNIKPKPLSYEWEDFYKLRVGDWRVAYRVKNKIKVIIHRIKLRDKMYK